jgi:hypothetical protein
MKIVRFEDIIAWQKSQDLADTAPRLQRGANGLAFLTRYVS